MTPRLSSIGFLFVNTALSLCTLACHPPAPPVTPAPAVTHVHEEPPEARVQADASPDLALSDLAASSPKTPAYAILDAPPTPITSCTSPPEFTKTSFKETDQLSPQYNAAAELTLFPSSDSTTSPDPFRIARKRLYFPPAQELPAVMHAWSPDLSLEGAPVAGLIRARIAPGRSLDATLLLQRAPGALRGVAVTFTQKGVSLTHITPDAEPEPLTRTEVIYSLDTRKELELIATILPTHLHVQLHDTRTGVELVSLTALMPQPLQRDPLPVHPTLLVSSAHTSSSAAHLTWISARPLCTTDLPEEMSEVDKPPRIFATFTEDALRVLPTRPRRITRHDGAPVHEITQPALERLHCEGFAPSYLSAEIPWAAVDDDYMSYRDTPVVRDEHGGFHTALSLKNPEMVHALMSAFHERFPDMTRLIEIGTTHQGTPIMAMAVANRITVNDPRPSVLLNGAHHGDEPISTEIVFDAMRMLLTNPEEDPRVTRWLDTFVVWLVPQVNPDGARAFLETSYRMGRKNGRETHRTDLEFLDRGVDLNRNYPFEWGALGEEGSSSDRTDEHYRGAAAASEPESSAIMALAAQEHFAASISYHTGTVCVIAPYTIENVPQPDINDAWTLGRHISRAMPQHPERRSFRLLKNLYPVDGTDQDWLRARFGTAALLIEAVRRTPRDTCSRLAVIEANRPSYVILLERLLHGVALTGRVTNAAGEPVVAEVIIEEQALKHGESWRTRARDGLFFRLMDRPGTYSIRVEAPGYETWRERIKLGDDAPTTQDIVLTRTDQDDPSKD